MQKQVLLKEVGGLALCLFFFSRFIIFKFRNYFILCQIKLCIRRKPYFYEKSHSKLSKKDPENIT